ncbi:MAG: MarR family transcriptional regulator [Candidatus Thiodiazotropha sp.]
MRNKTSKNIRESSLGWMLKSLSACMDKKVQHDLSKHNLTQAQFGIMMTLLEEDGISQSEIGSRITMPGYATTRNLDSLEDMKLLERRQDPTSRRSYCIYLTDKGRAVAPELYKIVKGVNKELVMPFSKTEVEQFTVLLKKLLASWNENDSQY